MFENTGRTELGKLGEFGLIDHLTKNFALKNTSSEKGIGDDAAVLNAEGKKILISTDLLLEDIHFDLSYSPLKHLGYKSVIVNLSDIYAMNAQPKQITISIGISNRFSLEAMEEFYAGAQLACEKYGIDLIGGDTSSSQKGIVISVTVIGYANEEQIVYRNKAKKGDLLCVSGDLGAAYVGLQLMEREKQVFLTNPNIQPDLEGKDYIVERQLKPEAREDIIQFFEDKKILPTSMIDISDGLASEIIHICKQSKVGCVLYEEKIPIDPMTYDTAREFNLDPTTCALNGGEDYELLFTLNQEHYEIIKNNMDISIIGYITDESEGILMQSKSNIIHELKAQGWNSVSKM